jgi:hypothetical protein
VLFEGRRFSLARRYRRHHKAWRARARRLQIVGANLLGAPFGRHSHVAYVKGVEALLNYILEAKDVKGLKSVLNNMLETKEFEILTEPPEQTSAD